MDDLRTFFRHPHSAIISDLPRCDFVPAEALPQPFRELLVHQGHMTAKVEAYYGERLGVRVIDFTNENGLYTRISSLYRLGRAESIQFNVAQVALRHFDEVSVAEILRGERPLGRILADYITHRQVQARNYLRVVPSDAMMTCFGVESMKSTYGRLATISCSGNAAVWVLEVMSPWQAPYTAPDLIEE